MNLDRTGEPRDPDDESALWHDPRCGNFGNRRGWLGEDADGHPIPCLRCKPDLRRSEIYDSAHRPITDRARAAIEEDNRNA